MNEKARKISDLQQAASFSYAEIETALANCFGIDAAGQKGWLRARIQNLRRLGLVAASPGKGSTIDYSRDDADKWMVALELMHASIPPAKIVELIPKLWTPRPPRRREVPIAEYETLKFQLARARQAIEDKDHVILLVVFGQLTDDFGIGFTEADKAVGLLVRRNKSDPNPRRVTAVDLTALARAFDAALDEAQRPPKPEPSGVAGLILRAERDGDA
jgi:hypothetical protein